MNGRKAALVAIIATGALFLAACGSGSNDKPSATGTEGTNPPKVFTVGLSIPTGGINQVIVIRDSLVASGAKLGIKFETFDAQLNPQKQVSDINQMVAQKVDGIVVLYAMGGPESLGPPLEKARKAGIKLLGYNIVADPEKSIAPWDGHVDEGMFGSASKDLSNFVAHRLGDRKNVLGVGIGIPVPEIARQLKTWESQVTSLDSAVKWLGTVANPTDDIAGSQRVVSEASTRYKNEIDAVMAYSDASALGARIALQNAGVTHAVITGFTGDEEGITAIKDGKIDATIDTVPWRQGLTLAAMMYGLLHNDPNTPQFVANELILVDADNVADYVPWPVKLAEIKAGTLTCKNAGCPAGLPVPPQ